MTPFQAFEEAIRRANGQAPLARMVGCTQGYIWQLLRAKKPLPGKYALKAEAGTGVSRYDLAPDFYPREATASRPTAGLDALGADR